MPYVAGVTEQDGSNKVFYEMLVNKEYVKDLMIFRCPGDQNLAAYSGGGSALTGARHCSYSIAYSFAPGVVGAIKDDSGQDTPILADSQGKLRPHGKAGQCV